MSERVYSLLVRTSATISKRTISKETPVNPLTSTVVTRAQL